MSVARWVAVLLAVAAAVFSGGVSGGVSGGASLTCYEGWAESGSGDGGDVSLGNFTAKPCTEHEVDGERNELNFVMLSYQLSYRTMKPHQQSLVHYLLVSKIYILHPYLLQVIGTCTSS
jgi:hypothetical protein